MQDAAEEIGKEVRWGRGWMVKKYRHVGPLINVIVKLLNG
jgi:hypothetical protein